MTVEFGWMLPTGKQRIPTGNDVAHIRDVLTQINGMFTSFWIPDHFMDDDAPIPESLTTLAYLAGLHPTFDVGTCVLGVGYRNPALLAKTAATMQHLTDGRFVLGIGAGWKADEYRAYGYDFPATPERIAALGEAVQICKQLWRAGGEPVTFRGDQHSVEDALCTPEPSPAPPIMIGGTGEKLTLRVVAQHADWWNIPGAPPDVVRHKSEVLARHCADVGRDPASIRRTWMGVVSIAESQATAEAIIANYPIWPGDRALVGTPAAIRDQLAAYVALGVDLFILSFADEPHTAGIHLFARVMCQM